MTPFGGGCADVRLVRSAPHLLDRASGIACSEVGKSKRRPALLLLVTLYSPSHLPSHSLDILSMIDSKSETPIASSSTTPSNNNAYTTPTSDQLPAYSKEDVVSLFTPSSRPTPSHTALPQPVALPQINTAFDSPFVRAYAYSLAQAGISQQDWLAFQDGLNAALIGSPPLQIVDTVGKVIGFVPSVWAMAAGISMQVVAQTGQHILSKTLTDKYLRFNNETFFKPRGLVVSSFPRRHRLAFG